MDRPRLVLDSDSERERFETTQTCRLYLESGLTETQDARLETGDLRESSDVEKGEGGRREMGDLFLDLDSFHVYGVWIEIHTDSTVKVVGPAKQQRVCPERSVRVVFFPSCCCCCCLRTRSSTAMDVVCGLTAFMVRQEFKLCSASRYPVIETTHGVT